MGLSSHLRRERGSVSQSPTPNVHVNRVLQELRADNLISLKGGVLSVLDWDALKKAGQFDATYLHLKNQKLAA